MQNRYRLQPAEIAEAARKIRKRIISMNSAAGEGHTGADLSEADILSTLYFNVLRVDPDIPEAPDRDRFILSKGHGVGGYYCTLAEAGFIDPALLDTYLKADSLCPGHPVRQKTPGIELNTGALGHGLPVAFGLALAARKQRAGWKTWVLLGDGELAEGSNWEAAMAAAHYHLDNLVCIVDRNGLQLADRTESILGLEPLGDKWRSFGFDVSEADGNDPADLLRVIGRLEEGNGKPKVIIASTVKGKGVSFIEDQAAWHHRIPVGEEISAAIKELD
ncbi:transketolase [Marispirochaeta sp.]|jgi:transketolase|uniref:transketolase n=1 Tax=Marispirochaeta sp. TaxID=2038653 RepID=UPI0029C914BB|nr:transketolase [Marispirochaeta sp.]